MARSIDVEAFINAQPVGALQRRVLWLCFALVALDGIDTASIAFIAPALKAEWQLLPAMLGPLFGAGLFGLMLGALGFGPLSDRIGRKPVLLLTCLIFGSMSLLSGFVRDLDMLIALRFLTGLGLGGAMPNAITLASEYCPQQRRASLVTLMFCGFTLGSALGGLLAAAIIPHWGWRAVLWAGGVLPLCLLPLLFLALPESVRFLALRGGRNVQIGAILRKLAPSEDVTGAHFTGQSASQGLRVRLLFSAELIRGTLLLWTTCFMSLLVVYLLTSWLPTLLTGHGVALGTASLVAMTFNIGGTLGGIWLGRRMDQRHESRVLAVAFASTALFIFLIGWGSAHLWLVSLCVFIVGWCVSGGQVGVNALAAGLYPTAARATGVSWANAIGRCGSVLGSMTGGYLLALGWDMAMIFALLAVPALIAGLALWLMPVRAK